MTVCTVSVTDGLRYGHITSTVQKEAVTVQNAGATVHHLLTDIKIPFHLRPRTQNQGANISRTNAAAVHLPCETSGNTRASLAQQAKQS